MDGPVEIAIRKVGGKPMRKAAVHPRRKATSCTVRDGYAYVVMEKPGLIADETSTVKWMIRIQGKGYQGPPIHTLTHLWV